MPHCNTATSYSTLRSQIRPPPIDGWFESVRENRDVASEGGLAAPQNHTDFVSGRIVIDGDERSVCRRRADLRCAGEQRHSVSDCGDLPRTAGGGGTRRKSW
jgi:hypothetical protein